MKLQSSFLIATTFLAVISFNAVADTSKKNEPTKCSLKTLRGTYTWTAQTAFSATAGMESFDGQGHIVTRSSSNSDLSFNKVTGTYTVNEDCTGTYTEGSDTDAMFISPDGNSFSWVETDQSSSDNISSGLETRISKALLVK